MSSTGRAIQVADWAIDGRRGPGGNAFDVSVDGRDGAFATRREEAAGSGAEIDASGPKDCMSRIVGPPRGEMEGGRGDSARRALRREAPQSNAPFLLDASSSGAPYDVAATGLPVRARRRRASEEDRVTIKVAVIGAGNVGGNLGARISKSGAPVKFGVRSTKDTEALLARCASDASMSDPHEAARWGDVVILAVPGSAAIEVARSLAKDLEGKVLVDCNNPMIWKDGPVWNPPLDGSLSAALAKVAPGARVVKAFNTFGAEFHADPALPGGSAQVFLAGDDAEAKKKVIDVATQAGFRTVDSGPLRNAAVLENLAMLWIHLATVGGHGRTFAFTTVARG
jgi:NADPH-dependent F420 reductase